MPTSPLSEFAHAWLAGAKTVAVEGDQRSIDGHDRFHSSWIRPFDHQPGPCTSSSDARQVWTWSYWRRRHQHQARLPHYRRRGPHPTECRCSTWCAACGRARPALWVSLSRLAADERYDSTMRPTGSPRTVPKFAPAPSISHSSQRPRRSHSAVVAGTGGAAISRYGGPEWVDRGVIGCRGVTGVAAVAAS